MGTVKYTGPVASFHCPTEATIRSLKVHFSPKQAGSGDPSPENVRQIEGWDGVEVYSYPDVNINIDNIPNEYKKINYLQSSGTQYIDTFVSGGNSTTHPKYEIIFAPINSTQTFQQYFAGERAPQGIPKLYKDGNRSACVVQKAGIGTKDCNIAYNEISKIVVSEDLCEVNGIDIEFDSSEALNGWGSSSWYIFNSHAEPTLASNMRLYGLKMWSNESLIRNFIPCCRKSDNKPGMYDTVSGEFFTNQGTGEFICGPDVGETVEYEFGVLGKNKVPFLVDSKTISSQINGNAGWCNVWKIPNKNLKYTYSAYIDNTNNTNTANITVWLKNIDNTSYVDGTAKSGTQVAAGAVGRSTITLDASALSNTYYFVFGITSFIKSGEIASCTFSNPMVEIGDTATTYEPYNPNKTVYGGWVDLISGEVQEEYKLLDKPWSEWGNKTTFEDGTELRYIKFEAPVKGNGTSNFKTSLCNVAKYLYGNENGTTHYYIVGNSYNCRVYLPTGTDENTQVQVLGELVTPITYHLVPTELQTFLGQNNVWSNADYIEVEYDLHETQDILARKQFIMANQPHVVKPAAAPLQNFVTDMVAPLKECKVHFSPVQDTSNGAPSPDNICPISGWTGLEVYRTGKNLCDTPTSANITANWPIDGSSFSKTIYGLPTDRTFTLQANITKDLGENISNTRFYLNGKLISGRFFSTGTPTGIKSISNQPTDDGALRLSHNRLGLTSYGAEFNNIQLELGSIATEYEPYSGTTIPITFPSEAGTIYGGYVDLIKGDLIETYKKINLGDLSVVTYGNASYDGDNGTNAMYYIIKTGTGIGYPNGAEPIGDKITCAGKNIGGYYIGTWTNPDDHIWEFCINSNNQLHVVFDNTTVGITSDMTFAQRREKITEWLQSNPINIVVPLETPIAYPLTPTQLKTLRGVNNIWASNGGDNIEIAYWTH